jgi:hypothetical protein
MVCVPVGLTYSNHLNESSIPPYNYVDANQTDQPTIDIVTIQPSGSLISD